MKWFALSLAVLLLLPAAAEADCASDPKNLLAKMNCGFDQDIAGWTDAAMGKSSHEPKEHALKGTDGDQSLLIEGPCVQVKPSTKYTFGLRIRTASGSPYFVGMDLFTYTDANCKEGAEPLHSAALPPNKTWQSATESATTSATTRSIHLRIAGSGEPGFSILFDDLFLNEP
ncbi:MAG TPA: hypothetical protein VEK79_14260 [Thermoanaerobaculia bacterium]|nr:hypothetical protein [Thermoanaerobaculia bacterium]